jgi:hypothetical protein
MNERTFKATIIFIAAAFTAIFLWLVIPAQMANTDIIGAFVAGFVNPYSSGHSTDVFACWFILVAWIVYEARTHRIRHGWICAVLGIVPGVAAGFGLYLLVGMAQLKQRDGTYA